MAGVVHSIGLVVKYIEIFFMVRGERIVWKKKNEQRSAIAISIFNFCSSA